MFEEVLLMGRLNYVKRDYGADLKVLFSTVKEVGIGRIVLILNPKQGLNTIQKQN